MKKLIFYTLFLALGACANLLAMGEEYGLEGESDFEKELALTASDLNFNWDILLPEGYVTKKGRELEEKVKYLEKRVKELEDKNRKLIKELEDLRNLILLQKNIEERRIKQKIRQQEIESQKALEKLLKQKLLK